MCWSVCVRVFCCLLFIFHLFFYTKVASLLNFICWTNGFSRFEASTARTHTHTHSHRLSVKLCNRKIRWTTQFGHHCCEYSCGDWLNFDFKQRITVLPLLLLLRIYRAPIFVHTIFWSSSKYNFQYVPDYIFVSIDLTRWSSERLISKYNNKFIQIRKPIEMKWVIVKNKWHLESSNYRHY